MSSWRGGGWFGAMGVLLASSLGCTGLLSSPEARDNARACQDWVDHMNHLECVSLTYDADEVCQGADASPADMASYFDCARAHARCEEGELVADVSGCRQPTM